MDINITERFKNNNKRQNFTGVFTAPAMYESGSHRAGTPPSYIKCSDAYIGSVLEPDTIIQKVYLRVTEPFPSGITATVCVNGTDVIVNEPVDTKKFVVSTTEDILVETRGNVKVTFNGSCDEIKEGELAVIYETISIDKKTGSYSA